MKRGRDPVERAASDDEDLQEVATWEPRTWLDRAAAAFTGSLVPAARGMLVVAALAFTAIILLVSSIDTPRLPVVALFAVVSVIPALALAAYVYVADVTTQEPLDLLVTTFALAFLFASFAAVVNTAAEGVFFAFGGFGVVAYYLFVVAPGEEIVKLLAVRFHAYGDGRFDAVVDGAVYGAVAGLGFAAIENAIYVTGFVQTATAGAIVDQAIDITQRRALAGPGHVIYSAIAGYYLGLAKFNERHRGALVVKGIVVAAGLHALYNISVGVAPAVLGELLGVGRFAAFVLFVAVFDGAAGGYLFLKLRRYRRAYDRVGAGGGFDPSTPVDATEVDPSTDAPAIEGGAVRARSTRRSDGDGPTSDAGRDGDQSR
ncbi:PrsW family intramembrane metalloprotease [Halorubellus sp. JP-L1]|uniref:PrsW family intramembrane metalloprotease n=1 Tax=Halorubellus sp. JP-L1 TaxID=2715753 RepID=UPI001407AB8E|nr:PrsW family glutamic-type intramembrane protease [Halorubellus sp. JP-L1]NHN42009.1 PrsW family intramembrane metalloprotease [Halorubellus sp. JP-L1]